MPEYVVFSTSDTPYQWWQCELLEHSFELVSQPGQLVCLCSASENEGDTPTRASSLAQVVALPSYMHDPDTGDFWGIANKFMSLREWISEPSLDGSVLLLDPDMVFLHAVELSVQPGQVIGQRWNDAGIGASDIFDKYCRRNRERITDDSAFMYPYLMHVSDIRRTMDRYVELCQTIRREENKWESDMFALVIVAAEFELEVSTRQLGVCNNWVPHNQLATPLVHFPSPFRAASSESIWFKQDFTASTETRPCTLELVPDRAQSRAEHAVLSTLRNFINQQKIDASSSDFLYWRKFDRASRQSATPKDRFLVFDPWPGGFNNIRMSFEIAAVLAMLLGRVLVLPPRSHFYLLEGESTLADFFDCADLGLDTISFEAYCQQFGISLDGALEEIWQRVAETACCVDWNVVDNLICIPNPPADCDFLERYRIGRPMVGFDAGMRKAQTLYFPQNLLGNFYLTIYAEGRLDDMAAYVARHIHYRKRLFLEAHNVIEHLGDQQYAAIHVRRNDFQYKDLFVSGEEILENVRGVLREGETLYIATDAEDKGFLTKPRKEPSPSTTPSFFRLILR